MLLHGMKQEENSEVLQVSHPAQQFEQQNRKRSREDIVYENTHKDDKKTALWPQTSLEHPQITSVQSTPWIQSQLRASLLPDPTTVYDTSKQAEADTTHRLPSIKHLQLDPRSIRREQQFGTASTLHQPTTPHSPHPHVTTSLATPHSLAYSSYSNTSYSPQIPKSPLKVTQTISPPITPAIPAPPPPPPKLQATELVQVKTNNFGFIETTFTNVPVKKAHRRRPANVDKGSLYCHTCGSKNTPEWRRGPQGPATLCNACGLAYAKRLRQEEENHAATETARFEEQEHPRISHPTQYSEMSQPSSQFAPYPTLALSELYQRPGLFHPPPGYQQQYEHITEHASGTSYGWSPPTHPSYSPSRQTFRSANNRPNGHTFHIYNPPVAHARSSPYLAYPDTNNAHVPMTTTTTTTTTSVFPFNLSPSDIPIITPSEPPNLTNSTAITLPVLTTLSCSTGDETATLTPTFPTTSRYPSLAYRIPNLQSQYPASYTPSSPPTSTSTSTTSTFSANSSNSTNSPNTANPATSITTANPAPATNSATSATSIPSSYATSTATPTISATYATSPLSVLSALSALSSTFPTSYTLPAPYTVSSLYSMIPPSSLPTSTIPPTTSAPPPAASSPSTSTRSTPLSSPATSIASSPASSPTSSPSSCATRSHSPTLTPITTIAALSHRATPPSS